MGIPKFATHIKMAKICTATDLYPLWSLLIPALGFPASDVYIFLFSELSDFRMLILSRLHNLLSQVLSPPHLHTAILFTPAGELVSVATEPTRSRDEIRILVAVAGEVWQETREQGYGMVESDVGYFTLLSAFRELMAIVWSHNCTSCR